MLLAGQHCCLIVLFSNKILKKKTVGLGTIRIWIIGVTGKHADHKTNATTAEYKNISILNKMT